MKIRQLGAELFHADGHMTQLIVAFRNFMNATKIVSVTSVHGNVVTLLWEPEETDVGRCTVLNVKLGGEYGKHRVERIIKLLLLSITIRSPQQSEYLTF